MSRQKSVGFPAIFKKNLGNKLLVTSCRGHKMLVYRILNSACHNIWFVLYCCLNALTISVSLFLKAVYDSLSL